MKRNVFKRALRTFWQAGIPAFLVAVTSGVQSGEYGLGMLLAALVAGASAGLSAAQNVIDNRRREGPVED